MENKCEEDIEESLSLKKFSKKLNLELKNNHLRLMNPKEIKRKVDFGLYRRKPQI